LIDQFGAHRACSMTKDAQGISVLGASLQKLQHVALSLCHEICRATVISSIA
jgi:hypothetical protein